LTSIQRDALAGLLEDREEALAFAAFLREENIPVTDTLLGLLGLGVTFISAALMVGLSVLRSKSHPVFRDIPAFTRMRHAVGRVVEDGTRLHVSLGVVR